MGKQAQAVPEKKKELFYSVGTVVFQCSQYSVILDREGNLHWIENRGNLIPEKSLGKVYWIVFGKVNLNLQVQSAVPFEQAVEEDLAKDFERPKEATKA